MPPPRKPKRLLSGLAVLFGLAWGAFEVSRLPVEGAEAWVWLVVAGLMVALGVVGVLEKPGGKM